MCRSQYDYYGRKETIPGKLIDGYCYVTENGKLDYFKPYRHRYDVLVIKK